MFFEKRTSSGMAFLALWIPLYRDRPVGRGSHWKTSLRSPTRQNHQAPCLPRRLGSHLLCRPLLALRCCDMRRRGGATERAIMDQTRHRSLKQVRKYIRRGSLFKDNAAARSAYDYRGDGGCSVPISSGIIRRKFPMAGNFL